MNPRLRRACDSLDLCQAVLGSFFVRVAAGQYEVDAPEQLLKLLATMLRNKVSKLARHEQAERRDQRRVTAGSARSTRLPRTRPAPAARCRRGNCSKRFGGG